MSVCILLLLAAAVPAQADRGAVCSRAENTDGLEVGASLAWFRRDPSYAFFAGGTADIAGDIEFQILNDSFRVWENAVACHPAGLTTDLQFFASSTPIERDLVGFNFLDPGDNENLLIFRDTGWPHSSEVVALTTATYATRTGEILDADIEFNSQVYNFTAGDALVEIDLMNTAVHEIGHFLGLGHPDEEKYPEVDPGCQSDATMCRKTNTGETAKRDLTCFDSDAIVFKYPADSENRYCSVPACAAGFEGCGPCSAAECEGWANCGFCARPEDVTAQPTITITGFDDGQGCSCMGSRSSAGAGFVLAVALLDFLRRRGAPRLRG